MRSEGTDNSFSIELRESLHLTEHGMRVGKLRLTNSFLTIDLGKHLYYEDGAGGINSYAIPEQASVTQSVTTEQEWLSDAALRAYSSGFPAGTSNTAPLSLGTVPEHST